MSHHFAFETKAVSTDDLHLLETVLARWCEAEGVDMSSPKARAAAISLVDLFRFGVRKEKELDHMLRRVH